MYQDPLIKYKIRLNLIVDFTHRTFCECDVNMHFNISIVH